MRERLMRVEPASFHHKRQVSFGGERTLFRRMDLGDRGGAEGFLQKSLPNLKLQKTMSVLMTKEGISPAGFAADLEEPLDDDGRDSEILRPFAVGMLRSKE
jgi:hypothetical protein